MIVYRGRGGIREEVHVLVSCAVQGLCRIGLLVPAALVARFDVHIDVDCVEAALRLVR